MQRCFGLKGPNIADDLRHFYLNHTRIVRSFAENFNHKLVEVDIESADAASLLEREFGIPGKCWGKRNVNVA